MPLSPGDTLGPYEILAPLGAGGMGEVYKARDTRLDRFVAVKVLPDHIARRDDLRARFEREARAVASLNHPHICVLFDTGPNYMVMELIEGETLEARIARGALPLATALEYARQIADALDRAHRAGVTHRDIKPGNIMLTRDGVKILDFGLAKSTAKPGPTEATVVASLTTEGTVLGTPQYMAPEQFEGKEADTRADIWAFGAVVYEMVTGRKAFEGKNYSSLVGAILSADPAPMAVKPFTPAWLERMVRRCLEKDPEDRRQSMRDIVLDLKSPPTEQPAAKPSSARLPWAAAAVALIAATLAWLPSSKPPPASPAKAVRFRIDAPEGSRITSAYSSPDGAKIVVTITGKRTGTFIRPLDSDELKPLLDTAVNVRGWTPDSRAILYADTNRLLRKDLDGGPPYPFRDLKADGSTVWLMPLSGGDIVYHSSDGALRLWTEKTGLDKALTKPATGERHGHPMPIDGGKRILYRLFAKNSGWYIRSLDDSPEVLGAGPFPLTTYGWLHEGKRKWWVFVQDGRLLARAIREPDWNMEGPAITLAPQVGATELMPGGMAVITASAPRPAYAAWFDRSGKLLESVETDRSYGFGGALSPDGGKLAAPEGDELWMTDLEKKSRVRLTFAGKMPSQPVWAPDGTAVVYSLDIGSTLVRKGLIGADKESPLPIPLRGYATDWSRDGRYLLFYSLSPNDIYVLPMTGGASKLIPLETSSFGESGGRFSPDGKWISYASDESGQFEIYVRDFDGTEKAKSKWMISNGGGSWHRWREDGREIIYLSRSGGALMSVAVNGSDKTFSSRPPVRLFDSNGISAIAGISKDGQRILLTYSAKPRESHATVIVNIGALLPE